MAQLDKKHVVRGLEGGIIAGISFGAMLGLTGTISFISEMTGSPVLFLFLVHIFLSVLATLIFSVLLGDLVNTDMKGLILAISYGIVLWVLSSLIMWIFFKKYILGLEVFLPLLWAHLLYGFLLGVIYDFVVPDSEQIDK